MSIECCQPNLPFVWRKIGQPMADTAQRYQVRWIIVVLAVIDVVNMKSANFGLRSSTYPARKSVSPPDLQAERSGEGLCITGESGMLVTHQLDAIRAVHALISAVDQTRRSCDRPSTTGAVDRDRVVMSIVLAAFCSMRSGPRTGTFLAAKVMCDSFQVPLWAFKRYAALFACERDLLGRLQLGRVTMNELSKPSAFVKLIQRLTTTAGTFNDRILSFFHGWIVARIYELSKTTLCPNWKGGDTLNAGRFGRGRERQAAAAFSPWATASVEQ